MRYLDPQWNMGRRRRSWILVLTAVALALSICIGEVMTLPTDGGSNQWPTFPRRNIASLARGGYFKTASSYKRSISTLAKNGQLPTFRSPYDDSDKHEQEEGGAQEKRNVASIARLRSFAALKRNVQALARDGYRGGRSQYGQTNDKRNIAAMARNGLLNHKRDSISGDEFYFPFYQNQVPPLSELDEPMDVNELYDYQQSINPDMLPPLSQVFKRDIPEYSPQPEYPEQNMIENNWYFKRGSLGLPVHGLIRPIYLNEPSTRNKRYILSLPDEIDKNDIPNIEAGNENNENEDKRSVDEETFDNFEKRHIGSLARKHSADENFGIRQYFTGPQVEPAVDTDDSDVPAAAVPAHSHPTGRFLNRVNNDVPTAHPLPSPPLTPPYNDAVTKNRWITSKEAPKFYYFRSLKVPYQPSNKRYLVIPTVDNILLRKNYRNSSLPSRRKNQ